MPRVRVVLSLGLPDPDLISTALAWSLLGHVALLIAVLIWHAIPSRAPMRDPAFFVKLSGAPAPPGAGASPALPRPAPAAPAAATPSPANVQPPPRPAPASKAVIPAPKPAKTAVPSSPTPAQPAGPVKTGPAPGTSGQTGQPAGVGGAGSGGEPGDAGTTGVGATTFGEGDFEFGWYQSAVEAKLESNWRRPIAGSGEIETATVSFSIRRDGTIESVQIATPSGNSALDLSVLRAVYDSNKLPVLPKTWSGESVHVTMEFRLTPDSGQ